MKTWMRQNESSKTWYARVSAGRHPDGRRRQICLSARTRRLLEKKIAVTIADFERGFSPGPKRMRMSELFDEWLGAAVNKKKAFRTVDAYRDQIRLYLKPSFGGMFVADVDSAVITRALNRWESEPRLDGRPGDRSSRTLCYPLTTLKLVMDYAISLKLVHYNPVRAVQKPKIDRMNEPEMSPAKIQSIIQAFTNSVHLCMIWLATTTGLRRGELCALKWGRVNLSEGFLEVKETYSVRGRYRELRPPKTRKGLRRIPLPTVTCRILENHRLLQEPRLRLLGFRDFSQVPVFDNGLGKLRHPDSLSTAFSREVSKEDIEHATLHGSRHGFSSLGATLDVTSKARADLLGHESSAFTDNRYTYLEQEAIRRDMERVAEATRSLLGAEAMRTLLGEKAA